MKEFGLHVPKDFLTLAAKALAQLKQSNHCIALQKVGGLKGMTIVTPGFPLNVCLWNIYLLLTVTKF